MINTANKTAPADDMLQSLFRSNHQLGVTTRFASAIAHINDCETLATLVQSALIDFGMSGLFQVKFINNKQLKKFGSNINREIFDRLVCIKSCADKICCQNNFIIFCLNHFTLVLDATNLNKQQIDETKDNLAIFCDIIDAWVTNHIDMQNFIDSTEMVKSDMLGKITQLTQSVDETSSDIRVQHLEISQSLLLMLASRFPTLGLEVDQEEEILMSIENTIEVYGKLINSQVQSNDDLKNLLTEAADCIESKNDNNPVSKNTSGNDSDNIMLF